MSRIRMLSAGAIVISVIATTLAFAGEDRPRPERGPGRMGPRERLFDQMPQDVRDAFEKQRRGEQLTPEEAAKLDEFRGGMRDRIQRAFGRLTEAPGPAKPKGPLAREKLNPVDAALQTIAEVHLKAQQFDQAVAVLERMTQSPDAAAVASAHFNIATICRRNLGQTDKAIAEYKKVLGPLAFRAWTEILACYEELGEFEKGVAALEEILAAAQDKPDKVKLLNLVARAWDTHGQPDKAVAALERLVNLLPYAEAAAMKDLYAPSDAEIGKQQADGQPQFNYRPFE